MSTCLFKSDVEAIYFKLKISEMADNNEAPLTSGILKECLANVDPLVPERSVDGSVFEIATSQGVNRLTLDSSAPSSEKVHQERCTLEDFTRCSTSHLWKLMMSFYDRKGIESWSQGVVPHFITSNAFIGKSYAKVSVIFM